MGELDQVYESYDKKRKYTKEEWIEYKKKEKSDVYALIDTTAEKIIENGEMFKTYLDTQSKFEQYSVGNTLLITAQMPDATILKDYEGWLNAGGFPKKNRKDIKILEPGDSYMREDGSVAMNYNVKYMSDISQVNIRQKQGIMKYDDKLLLRVFLQSSQSEIQIVDRIPDLDKKALYDTEKDILYVAKGAEVPKIFHEVTQELAKQEIGEETAIDTFKINCVSYMICKKYGIDVSDYNVTDIPYEFKNMTAKEIREELEPIHNSLERISGRINYCIESLAKQNKETVQTR